jgi:DNA polymerase-3 subunit alpha
MNQCPAERVEDNGCRILFCLHDPGHEGEHRFERSEWEPAGPSRVAAPAARRYVDQEFLDYPDVPPWSRTEELRKERQVLWTYVSGHPLDRYGTLPEDLGVVPIASLRELKKGAPVKIAGTIEAYEERLLRENWRPKPGELRRPAIAYFLLLDRTGYVRCKITSDRLREYGPIAGQEETVIIAGQLKFYPTSDEEVETMVIISKLARLSKSASERTKVLGVRPSVYKIDQVERFVKLVSSCPGSTAVDLTIPGREKTVRLSSSVLCGDELLSGAERIFGSDVKFSFSIDPAASR